MEANAAEDCQCVEELSDDSLKWKTCIRKSLSPRADRGEPPDSDAQPISFRR
jgi:hypothetical protein